MLVPVLLVVLSLVLLYFGAEWLVKGAASSALRLGLTPLVVGLTVVAYGTSAPEMLVSVKAALSDQGAIAVGNVIGSNIFNIAVILGLAAVVSPLRVEWQLLRIDTPVMLGTTLIFVWCFRDAVISRGEALVFVLGATAYTVANVWMARRQTAAAVEQEFAESVPRPSRHWGVDVGLILGGLAVLVAGSRLLVDNAVLLARSFGVSEAVIGLTIVAAGTSMPELATSVVAALRKQADIALGNVIGSSTFNILAILGVAGLVAPVEAAGISRVDLLMLVAVSALLWPMLWTGRCVNRWEGVLFLVGYGGYLVHLWPKG